MSFIILLSISRSLKLPIEQFLGKVSPGIVERLLLYERVEVKVLVILIRLGTRVAQTPLLVKLFGDLRVESASVVSFTAGRTSRTFFGVMCRSLEPDC